MYLRPTFINKINCSIFYLLGLFLLSGINGYSQVSARYRITFQSTWSNTTHPGGYPANAHYSGLIGMTHNANAKLFELDVLASPGIVSMAETGSKNPLLSEIQTFINAETGQNLISGGGLGSPGSVSVEVDIQHSHPLVSITTMIAPSPDWFTGVQNVNLYANGDWATNLSVPVAAYDAGSDSGPAFTSGNQPTNPRVPVFMINTPPLATNGVVPSLGNMIFERIDGGNECITNRTVSDNPASGNYNASETIITSTTNPVEITTDAIFKAGQSITLNVGFYAKTGSSFTAVIDNCSSNFSTPASNLFSNLSTVETAAEPFLNIEKATFLQITPNPIYQNSQIQYFLPESTNISVLVLDKNGRLIQQLKKDIIQAEGFYDIPFDGANLQSGMYFIQLITPKQILTQKAVLIR